MAQHADAVVTIALFSTPLHGFADLVLPATSYLERDGTYVNLEGRVQRLRRTVIPPAPDELAWISKLAARFGVELSPYTANVFDELSALIYDAIPFGAVGEHAPLHERRAPTASPAVPQREQAEGGRGLRLIAYRPLFSGAAVDRVPELQFQRPARDLELARADARKLGIASGDEVDVRSNGTSARLRARVNRELAAGTVRAADEHVRGLATYVEVAKA